MRLFDIIFGKAIARRIAAYQNALITKHCDEVDNIYRQMRGWRHDYHNHIQAMHAMTDNPEELRKYLWMLNDDLTTVERVSYVSGKEHYFIEDAANFDVVNLAQIALAA